MSAWIPPAGYVRRPAREVGVGDVRLGGSQPIRVQSMTTPPPQDLAGTVDQIARLVDAGCEIVRLTIPTAADAAHLPALRQTLRRRGLRVPLVADIHFSPGAALAAVEHVEKVRINPGNFADSKRFAQREYTDAEYDRELSRLEEKLRPLVVRARELGVAMRIGTNHGSLSDRVLNRYGDTPLGMVESALEFARICAAHGYHELVLSMKASNPQITLQAYRLLAARLREEGMDYPFHLGVTEAGDGREGRIKSAIGIGALLEEGLGDTVRVSLTEDPVAEIPVAQALVSPFNAARPGGAAVAPALPASTQIPTIYTRRPARRVSWGRLAAGGGEPVRAEIRLPASEISTHLPALLSRERGAELVSILVEDDAQLDAARMAAGAAAARGAAAALAVRCRPGEEPGAGDARLGALPAFSRLDLILPADPSAATHAASRWGAAARELGVPVLLEWDLAAARPGTGIPNLLPLVRMAGALVAGSTPAPLPTLCILFEGGTDAVRDLARRLAQADLPCPLLLAEPAPEEARHEILRPSIRMGALLCDGVGDAVRVDGPQPPRRRLDLAYDILQGSRVRLSKTDFISCPSCGRTLFDLETTTRRIKDRTAHLDGVKIAIMGCVVNGLGEMADADFGYVGGAPGRVNLYVGRECVERHVPEAEADLRLIELIKQHGRWRDAPLAAVENAS